MNCHQCGATLEASATTCSYCGTATAAGVWQQAQQSRQAQAQDHWKQTQDAQRKAFSEAQVKSAAKNALVVSLIGLVICCIPLIPLAALIMGWRAKAQAKQLGIPVPANATVAQVISLGSLILFAAVVVYSHFDQKRVDERINKLEDQIADEIGDEELELDTACSLVELHVLREGSPSLAATSVEDVRCPGKLNVDGSEAVLDDVRVSSASTTDTLVACLRFGSEWSVTSVGKGTCDGSAPANSAGAGGAPAIVDDDPAPGLNDDDDDGVDLKKKKKPSSPKPKKKRR